MPFKSCSEFGYTYIFFIATVSKLMHTVAISYEHRALGSYVASAAAVDDDAEKDEEELFSRGRGKNEKKKRSRRSKKKERGDQGRKQ